MHIVEVSHLKKSFRARRTTVTALHDVSFTVRDGEVFAFLGPNGSGKTTTLNIISGLLLPDSGTVRLYGRSVNDPHYFDGVSFMSGDSEYLWSFSGEEILRFYAQLTDVRWPAVLDLVNRLEMDLKLSRKWIEFSNGEKTKLRLIRALLKEPRLLFLDEPTVGLDPDGARSFRDTLKRIKEAGTTIVLTSHYMQDIEALADTVCFIHQGRIESVKPFQEFLRLEDKVEIEFDTPPVGLSHLGDLQGAVLTTELTHVGEAISLGGVRSVRTVERDLEEYFIALARGESRK